eukprot:383872-Amphidinium_carterae.1
MHKCLARQSMCNKNASSQEEGHNRVQYLASVVLLSLTLRNRTMTKHHVLANNANVPSKPKGTVLLKVLAIEEDASIIWVIQPQQQGLRSCRSGQYGARSCTHRCPL